MENNENKKYLAVHFTSSSQTWNTPRSLFDPLNALWKFEVDCACLDDSALCSEFFTPETDGLSQDWGKKICWLNPPYDDIKTWTTKALTEYEKGATVVMLIPARTDTKAFHEGLFEKSACICFIKGRLKFANNSVQHKTTSAPFPSCLIVLDRNLTQEKIDHLKSIGAVVKNV